uniref:Uncharacterized protein n=1 Tax=Ignisphaera aggregans TaxID=334771 RepID=A0A7C4BB58_9CREN
MPRKVKLYTVLGDYVAIEVEAGASIELLRKIQKVLNKGGEDVEDSIRMIQHFDVFYSLMCKKFKDFLTPKKNISELLRGNVLVDKIKLAKRDDERVVVIVFDKSLSKDLIERALTELGYEVIL